MKVALKYKDDIIRKIIATFTRPSLEYVVVVVCSLYLEIHVTKKKKKEKYTVATKWVSD